MSSVAVAWHSIPQLRIISGNQVESVTFRLTENITDYDEILWLWRNINTLKEKDRQGREGEQSVCTDTLPHHDISIYFCIPNYFVLCHPVPSCGYSYRSPIHVLWPQCPLKNRATTILADTKSPFPTPIPKSSGVQKMVPTRIVAAPEIQIYLCNVSFSMETLETSALFLHRLVEFFYFQPHRSRSVLRYIGAIHYVRNLVLEITLTPRLLGGISAGATSADLMFTWKMQQWNLV